MTKKVAVINDLSGLGRCSLTAAISVLSAMGIQACPLPTAILASSPNRIPQYYCYDFTDKMDYFRQECNKLGTSFRNLYRLCFQCLPDWTNDGETFRNTFQTADNFSSGRSCNGRRWRYLWYVYSGLTVAKELAARADVITPNLTEFIQADGYRL